MVCPAAAVVPEPEPEPDEPVSDDEGVGVSGLEGEGLELFDGLLEGPACLEQAAPANINVQATATSTRTRRLRALPSSTGAGLWQRRKRVRELLMTTSP